MGAATIAALLGAVTMGSGAPAKAHASMSAADLTDALKTYKIAKGPVAQALNRLADDNNVRLIYKAPLTLDLRTRGLSGRYSLRGALDKILADTGLGYSLAEDGKVVTIQLAQAATGTQSDADSVALPTIDIEGKGGGPGGRFTGYSPDFNRPAAATKSNIPIIQSPTNVQVVPREVLDDQQAITLKDAILNNVSSVSVGYQQLERFVIRGFDVGNNIYRNGLRSPLAAGRETANLQSIEVLKGPAAMLYGRIEPGGLINLVTKRPLLVPYYSVQEQAGSFGFTRTTVDATGPLTADNTLAYRFNGAYVHSDSFRNFVTSQNALIAPTISYQPIEQFRLNIEGEYRNSVFVDTGDTGIPAIGRRPANIPISRYLGDPSINAAHPNRQESAFIGYDWTYDIAENWSLTNRFGYFLEIANRRTTNQSSLDEVTGIENRVLYYRDRTTYNVTSNLNLKGMFRTGLFQHKVLVGADYLKSNQRDLGFSGTLASLGPINIYNPVYTGSGLSGFSDANFNTFSTIQESWKGVYAQDFISFSDNRLHLLLGGRYDWANSGSGFSQTSFATAEGSVTNALDRAFSPYIGAVVQPLPWLSFYGNFSQSFGVSNAVPTPGQPPFSPQKGIQYEGGAKAEFLDGRLTATLAFYDITKSNILRLIPNSVFSIPIGEAESKGVELDIAGRLNENWSIIGSFSHDDARITQDSDVLGTGANTGHRVANVPLNAGNL